MSFLDENPGQEAGALPSHAYFHVPFCASKCSYCDFASIAGADDDTAELVFRAMRTQLRQWERSGLEGVLETLYFGGGTPTLFADKVVSLLGNAREHFAIHSAAEVTVEANPDSLDTATAKLLASAGVTRVSVGVQSFDERDLKVLGRRHDVEGAHKACEAVISAGMALSIDLICGIPGQARSSWADTLLRAVETGAGHVSVYPLSIEEGTQLEFAIQAGLLEEPDQDLSAEAMTLAEAFLGQAGFERYEVASYASSAEARSRHNTAYWTGRSYLGIGPAAHGMLDVATARAVMLWGEIDDSISRVRYSNAASIDDWLMGTADGVEMLTESEADREDAMLGLRLLEGISDELAARAGVTHICLELETEGLLGHRDGRWRTTQKGWLLGNEVFARIWGGE